MGMYKDMVTHAREAGIANEEIMNAEINNIDRLLCDLKEEHPELYWDFIREAHENIYGEHYDETFAMYDVDNLTYTDKMGVKRKGAHWTNEEIKGATSNRKFPNGTTDWDKYVAFNTMYADLCKEFDDASILKAGYLFFFADDDWEGDGKVWSYMNNR